MAENTAGGQDIQHPISATDEDRDRLTYRLSGDDADSFTLNTSNGQLRTRSGVTYDYEDKDRYSVTVEADDRRGGAASIDVTIYVADVAEPPQAPARPRVEPASFTSLTVTWTEPANTGPGVDGYDVQYRKSGSFLPWPHSGSGTSTTITDLDLNTRYEVQVRASNDEGTGAWSSSGFGTTSANQRPVFDEGGSATRSLAENTPPDRDIGTPLRAADPEGGAVTYSLSGRDASSFTIDPNNGQLRTQTGVEYNYEVQNRYSVTVEAQDEQGGRATIAVTIDITDDDNERPQRPDRPSVTASTLTSLSVRWIEPSNTGPPITDYNVQYREGSSGAFTAAAHDGTGTTTTIANLQSDTSYEIQVQATSDEGTSQWSDSGNGRTVANQAPTFTEGSSTTRRLAENTTGTQDVGNPITASDGDGGTLTYRLEGTDRASFTLNVNQLRTVAGVTYDYEEKNSYVVIVRVEDGQGGSNTIEVAINLIDQQEPPETPSAPSVSAASSTSLTVTWDEPANTGPDIDDYDVQYREGDSGGFTSWTHNSAERTATITNLTPRTSYEVQVKARNAEGTSDWSPSGTGSTGANGRPIFADGSSATRALDENTTGVQNIGDPVSATDPENTTLTYSLEGTDKDAFTIDTGSGQLRTKSDQTYDHEATPRYVLSIKATDGHGGSSTILVLINLNDVNEPPAFTSDATFETVENGTRVGAVVARDEDSADDITNYTITGGADRDLFEIAGTNQLRFKDAPDFERPADAGGNNEYIVEVTATGGTGTREMTGTQTITVTVEDVDEPPGKPDPPTVSDETESSLTVTWTEPANTGPRRHQLPCAIPHQRRVHRLAGHRPVPDPHDHGLEFGQHLPDPGTGGERRRKGCVVQFGQRDDAHRAVANYNYTSRPLSAERYVVERHHQVANRRSDRKRRALRPRPEQLDAVGIELHLHNRARSAAHGLVRRRQVLLFRGHLIGHAGWRRPRSLRRHRSPPRHGEADANLGHRRFRHRRQECQSRPGCLSRVHGVAGPGPLDHVGRQRLLPRNRQ